MGRMRRTAAIALVATATGCGGGRLAGVPISAGAVRLADRAFATEYSVRREHIEVPFALDPHGVSATALALGFLRAAQARGAVFVSDLSIAIHFIHAGDRVECVSTIVVGRSAEADGHIASAATTAAASTTAAADDPYKTTVQPWEPDVVTAAVDDPVPVCKKVGHQVVGIEPEYASRTDAEVGRYIAPGEMPMHTDARIVFTDECQLAVEHRVVRRYAHFVVANIVPIDLARIEHDFADQHLTESAPVCRTLAAREQPAYRITGDLHYLGGLGPTTALPDILAR